LRLPGHLLAELTVAATLLAGGGFGAVRGFERVRGLVASRAAVEQAPPLARLQPRGDLSATPDLRVALEATGTFLGMSDELLLERVCTQPITRFKLNHGGSSISFRVDFADGSRAAWKPTQTNLQTIPRKEVAAYRLNRLLGMNAVPPAAPREVSREELFAHLHPESLEALPRIQAETVFGPTGKTVGTASYWIPVIKDSGFDTPEGQKLAQTWLSQGELIPPENQSMAAQLSDLVVFDFLTCNPDRWSGGNMKMSPDGVHLFFMDNTMAFFLDPEATLKNRQALMRTQKFSKTLYEALDRVTVATLEQVLAKETEEVLTAEEIRAVVARRDYLQHYVRGLMAEFGSRNVLVFP
jgi:hypothetical protein